MSGAPIADTQAVLAGATLTTLTTLRWYPFCEYYPDSQFTRDPKTWINYSNSN